MATRSKIDKSEIKLIIKEAIMELFADSNFMNMVTKTIQDKVDEDIKKIKDSIEKNENKVAFLINKIDALEQNEKINNICIYGIQEENQEVLNSKVVKIINDHTQLNYTTRDIMSSYRTGNNESLSQKPRPVIVKFKCFETKQALWKNCAKFKGSRLFIAEDLTKKRRELLWELKNTLGKENAWTFNGTVKAKINNKIVKINNEEDYRKYKEQH